MPAAHRREQRWELAALGLWLLLVIGIYFRPHEFIIGGADAGVYASLGANIVRTGSIRFVDPALASLDPTLYDGLLRTLPTSEGAPYYLLPAFYVPASGPAGEITPQFYHLHPVWFAVGYALAGLRGELLLTPLWGVLGCLAVYMTARQLWGWKVGLLALVGLSATALQIWFARYPTAEALTQYLFWTGIWAFTAWLDKREPPALWAALAGVALGEVFLTRIDAYVLLIVPILLGVWLWQTPAARRGARWFYAPLLLLAAQSLLHGWLLSRPYFATQIRFGQIVMRQGLALPVIAGVILVVVAGFLMAQPARRGRVLHWLRAARPILLWISGYRRCRPGALRVFPPSHHRAGKGVSLLVWRGRTAEPGSGELRTPGLVSVATGDRPRRARRRPATCETSRSAYRFAPRRRSLFFGLFSVADQCQPTSDICHAAVCTLRSALLHSLRSLPAGLALSRLTGENTLA